MAAALGREPLFVRFNGWQAHVGLGFVSDTSWFHHDSCKTRLGFAASASINLAWTDLY
jgi:hypothetical protein